MSFKTEKTGKHLRSMVVEKGTEERMRAMQALSHHYGTGSSATLAKLLMATLGHESDEPSAAETGITAGLVHSRNLVVGQVAEPMLNGANDSDYAGQQVG